eukprot:COSAG01_NODE_12490_length_1729_cov_115.320859_2_plen_320_part_01
MSGAAVRRSKRQRVARPAPARQGAPAVGASAGVDWLAHLSEELFVCVLQYLIDYSDCARLSLASPRLGLAILRQQKRQLPRFQHPLFAVATRLVVAAAWPSSVRLARGRRGLRPTTVAQRVGRPSSCGVSSFAEAWVPKYAADVGASAEDFAWIKAKSPQLYIERFSFSSWKGSSRWNLVRGGEVDALVRVISEDSITRYYEGEKGSECLVRIGLSSGAVYHFEGQKGSERQVRLEHTSGDSCNYEGGKGSERLVRIELASGAVYHYEGEKGSERQVRLVHTSGNVYYYEGEKGSERQVRVEFASGDVCYCEGEKGSERQ